MSDPEKRIDQTHSHEKYRSFEELRRRTHEEMAKELAERIRTNPHPTEEEILMGAFVEMLEPQVRDAVLTFRRKGYNTASSGFYGSAKAGAAAAQVIDGRFVLDRETKGKLHALGVRTGELKSEGSIVPYSSSVSFDPAEPDLAHIKQVWDRIAEILPDTGHHAPPDPTLGSIMFREQYGRPEDADLHKTPRPQVTPTQRGQSAMSKAILFQQ